jgi:hypothetical protein
MAVSEAGSAACELSPVESAVLELSLEEPQEAADIIIITDRSPAKSLLHLKNFICFFPFCCVYYQHYTTSVTKLQ